MRKQSKSTAQWSRTLAVGFAKRLADWQIATHCERRQTPHVGVVSATSNPRRGIIERILGLFVVRR